jgi:site-specific DNA-methyltransferase (adenine-specific)
MGRHRIHANDAARQRAFRDRRRAAALQPPCVRIGEHIMLYQADALTLVPLLQGCSRAAVVTDPPYGIDFRHAKPRRPRRHLQGYCSPAARWDDNVCGDDMNFDPTPWLGYPEVILWGADHYYDRLPAGGSWLIWDKRDGATSDNFGDCEIAWVKRPGPARFWSQKWRGIIRAGAENVVHGPKLHPCQKPEAMMQWCLSFTTGSVVLDPFMGSGTTGLACLRAGRKFIGIEIDPTHFETARKRLQAAVDAGTRLSTPPPSAA